MEISLLDLFDIMLEIRNILIAIGVLLSARILYEMFYKMFR